MLSRISVSLFRRSSARYSTLVEGTVCVRKGTTTTPPVVPRRAMTTTTALRAATTGQPQQQSGRRFASSHDDFAPQRTVVDDGEDEAITMIKQHVTDNPVMVYMKGTPSQPMCGFSAKTVQILQAEGIDFSSVNVLDYTSIREGVKKFSQWPTIPQLYVNGEFIGGCDIITQMHESGELKEVLAEVKETSAEESSD